MPEDAITVKKADLIIALLAAHVGIDVLNPVIIPTSEPVRAGIAAGLVAIVFVLLTVIRMARRMK